MTTTINMVRGRDYQNHSSDNGGGGGTGSNGGTSDSGDEGSSWNTIRFYNRLVGALILKWLIYIGLAIVFMLAVNVVAGPAWNLIPLFGAAILFTAIAVSPIPVVIAAVIGFITNSSPDGALRGIQALVTKFLPTGLMYLVIVTGFLATWSFRQNPLAFFYVAAGALLAVLVYHNFGLGGGKKFAYGVVAYATIIIVHALWTTIPAEDKVWIPGYQAEVTGPPKVTGYMNMKGGETVIAHMKGDVTVAKPSGHCLDIPEELSFTDYKTRTVIHAGKDWQTVVITAKPAINCS